MRVAHVVCTVLALTLASAAALAVQEPVAAGNAATAETTIVTPLGDTPPTQPPVTDGLSVAVEGRTVRALRDEQVAWEHRLPKRIEEDDPVVTGGLLHDGRVWYAVRADVFVVDARSGVVQRRERLPGRVSALTVGDDGAVVASFGDATTEPTWSAEAVVDPERDGYHPVSANLRDVFWYRSWAERVAAGALAGVDGLESEGGLEIADLLRETPEPEAVARAIAVLGTEEQRDPTNPWWIYWQARIAHAAGDTQGAQAAAARLMETHVAYGMELLAMAEGLDTIAPEIGDEAFGRGLGAAGQRGYIPQNANSLLGMITWLGRPASGDQRTTAYLARRAQRVWALTPYVEGGAYFYDGVATRLEDEGLAGDAALWRQRAALAAPYRVFGGPVESATLAGLWVTVLIAGLLALVAGFAVRFIWRIAPGLRGASTVAQRLVVTRAWSRLELLGFVALVGVIGYAASEATRGVSAIGRLVSAPVAVAMGFPGHPQAVAFWESQPENEGTRTLRAFALHHAGRLDEAEALYLGLPGPEAIANRGSIAAARSGDRRAAEPLWREAVAADPTLAAPLRNLGAAPPAGGAALLPPRGGVWIQPAPAWALGSAWEAGLEFNPDPRALVQLFVSIEPGDIVHQSLEPLATFHIASAVLMVFVLLGIFGRRCHAWAPWAPTSVLGWVLSFVVPGTARVWLFAGPLLTAATAAWLLMYWTWTTSDGLGVTILDVIAVPSFEQYFGAMGSVTGAVHAKLAKLMPFWWAPLALNAVIVLLAEIALPDPDGPIAWRREGRIVSGLKTRR
jgi:hypothetical protein